MAEIPNLGDRVRVLGGMPTIIIMTQLAEIEQGQRGRPVGSKTKISKLQRIANRLEQMARTQAMTIIQESLDGHPVDKDKLSTAKWTVTTAKEFHKAVLQEKEGKDSDSVVDIDEVQTEGATTFSLTLVQ